MTAIKRLLDSERGAFSYALPVFLILCMFAAVISIGVRQLSENEEHLHEDALSKLDLNAQIISQRLNDMYVSLEAAAPLTAFEAGYTQKQMQHAMTALRNACGFDFVVRTNRDGIAFNYLGKGNIDLSKRRYIREALLGRRAGEYVTAGKYDPSSAYIILAVPVLYGDQVTGVLHGSYKASNFDGMLGGFAGKDHSRTFIAEANGALIAASDRKADYSAFIRTILSKYADGLKAGQNGRFALSADGRKQYCYYEPLAGINCCPWIMASVTDQAAFAASTRSLKTGMLLLCAVAVCITAVLIYSVVRRQRLAELQARESRALANALADAKRADRAKSDFLSRMSHDMRTPLNGIIGMTYLAQELENPPRTRDCLEKIDTSSKFLLGLINDVLDMAKAESGKMTLHPEPYELRQLLSYVEAVIRPLCAEKGLQLIFDLQPVEKRKPVIDPLRFNQLCFNLLSNAVKYTPEGGAVTLQIHDKMLSEARLAMYLEISDTGIGMSEEFQRSMFEPFTQENRDDSSLTRGTGLGLAIAKKIIDVMGGTVEVRSKSGAGTSFRIQLEFDSVPMEEAAQPEPEEQATDLSCLAGRHILLCEDHQLNQEIAKALLSKGGMTVVAAENGLIGKEKFSRSAPGYFSAILMDIRMPVMDGYKATREIRALARPDAKTVPIIAMTADAFADDVQRCLDAGMNGHIAKPIEPELLYRTLCEAVAKQSG